MRSIYFVSDTSPTDTNPGMFVSLYISTSLACVFIAGKCKGVLLVMKVFTNPNSLRLRTIRGTLIIFAAICVVCCKN